MLLKSLFSRWPNPFKSFLRGAERECTVAGHTMTGGGLMLHSACRDALLVGRQGSTATPSCSSSSQHCPCKNGCRRAVQKLWHHSRGGTPHMKPYTQLMVTNVFSKKSHVSIKHRLTLLGEHILYAHSLFTNTWHTILGKIGGIQHGNL